MSTIHIQLIQRSPTLHAGDTITLRFPLDTTQPERDLTISEDVAPLLDHAEAYYYAPKPLRLRETGQTLYRWLDGADRFLTRAIDPYRGRERAVALLLEQGSGLDHLPWELLHDDTGYLVENPQTAVIPVRWRAGNVPDDPFYSAAQNRPLHVAFMATAPRGVEPPLDFEGEEARIVSATARYPLRLSVEESGNLPELGHLLGDFGQATTDVVHLTGHATHTGDGPRFLCEDEVGALELASAGEIHASLTHTPRLLFLSGCRTGQSMRGGSVASLAAELVDSGIPAVLGWGQPVYDTDATAAAALLYGGLAQGLPPVRALADTYREMLRRHRENPHACRHWHLLRLYARGAAGQAPPGLSQPLVTAPRTRGRARLAVPTREPEHLDDEGRVPVAGRESFVGRRRVLQRCLRALRPHSEHLGVIVHGLGGHGKSSLAHRLRGRWIGRSETHRAAVLYGQIDETLLLRKLNNALVRNQHARELLNSADDLRARLVNALEACDEQLLLILDNFEDNFEREDPLVPAGPPKLVNGEPLLRPETVQLLEDLLFALAESRDRGGEHRLLLTSRYRPAWRGADQLDVLQLDRLSAEAVQKKVARLTATQPRPQLRPQLDDATQPLRERAVTIADGNPRLLEWLFDLLAAAHTAPAAPAAPDTPDTPDTPDMDAVLARMAERESDLRENILADALLAAQPATLRGRLARGLTCELPVPARVFDALDGVAPALPAPGVAAPDGERNRATTLGLLEATEPHAGAGTHLRVPRIFAPLLAAEMEEEDQPDPAELAATAARTLAALWWEPEDARPNEAQMLELHRLALAGGETELAEELTQTLAGRWNRSNQYRYREVIELVMGTVKQVASPRLWNQIGYASRQLGEMQDAISHFQAALDALPDDEQELRGTILNNIGVVYSALGEKEQALGYFEQALPLRRAVGDRGGEATTLHNIGGVYDDLGEKEQALGYYEQALPLRRAVGDRGGEATTLHNIGGVYSALGEKEQALGYYEQALPLFRAVGDRGGEATTLNNIGLVYRALGEMEQALGYYEQALPLRRAVGDRGGEATTLNNIGGVYDALGEKEQALENFEAALLLCIQVGDRFGEIITRWWLGLLYGADGRLDEAVAHLEAAAAIAAAVRSPHLAAVQRALAQTQSQSTSGGT